MFKSFFGPKLVSSECIPGRKWVYKNFWGNRKTIERFDAIIEPAKDAMDADFTKAMKSVLIDIQSPYWGKNRRVQQLLEQKQPIKVTSYRVYDGIHSDRSRICGLIQVGDLKIKYLQSLNGGDNISTFDFLA